MKGISPAIQLGRQQECRVANYIVALLATMEIINASARLSRAWIALGSVYLDFAAARRLAATRLTSSSAITPIKITAPMIANSSLSEIFTNTIRL